MARGEELPRTWATMDHLTSLGEHRVHWAWGRVFFAVGMAITMCLKVSDVATLRWGWLQYPGWFVFFDYKVNKAMAAQPILPFWETWRRWLWENRRDHHHEDSTFIPGGPDTLRQLQRQLFKGTEYDLSGWHPWKRMGAACFRALGGSLAALAIWARWRTPRQAARYAAQPPSWQLPARVVLPQPTGQSGFITRDCEWKWIRVKELWHEDAFRWDQGRRKGPGAPVVKDFARPTTVEEVLDSDTDEDDVDMADDDSWKQPPTQHTGTAPKSTAARTEPDGDTSNITTGTAEDAARGTLQQRDGIPAADDRA